jgi:hypothetical protein
MDQLIESLPWVVRATGSAEEVTEAACLAVWNHIAGEPLRRRAVPLGYREEVLTIAVTDLVWQKQLQLLSEQLLFRINSALKKPLVRKIEILVDEKVVEATHATERNSKLKTSASALPADVVAAAEAIQDPKLRTLFLGAAKCSLDRRAETAQTES